MALSWSFTPFDGLTLDRLYALLALRQAVFVVEQSCAYLDADGRDALAHHLLGFDGPLLAAALRVFPPDELGEVWIGRVVTAPAVRGTGLGRPLMNQGLRRARATFGPATCRISAQAHLAPFYGSVGFELCGEGYLEDGIPHVPMRRAL
jgi:ElaA protein